MLSTSTYRGRRIVADNLFREYNLESTDYYKNSSYYLRNLRVVPADGDTASISVTHSRLGQRVNVCDSWTAWSTGTFLALLGDFVLVVQWSGGMMDPTDATYTGEALHLVTADGAHADNDGLLASVETLHTFTDDDDKALREIDVAKTLCGMHQELVHGVFRAAMINDQAIGTTAEADVPPCAEELVAEAGSAEGRWGMGVEGAPHYNACGGAALVVVDGAWRWLVPHDDGASAALQRVRATSAADDWGLLEPLLASADAREQALVSAHFSALGGDVAAAASSAYAANGWATE
jgi:hypothetical protein